MLVLECLQAFLLFHGDACVPVETKVYPGHREYTTIGKEQNLDFH